MGNKYPQFCRDCLYENLKNDHDACKECLNVALEPTHYLKDINKNCIFLE
jgi:hypothetical protein